MAASRRNWTALALRPLYLQKGIFRRVSILVSNGYGIQKFPTSCLWRNKYRLIAMNL
jgi:hypothetical protein